MNKPTKAVIFIAIFVLALPLLRALVPSGGTLNYTIVNETTKRARSRSTPATPAPRAARPAPVVQGADKILQDAFTNRQSNLQVQGRAVVSKVLSDDLKGSRHQRFILRLTTGQTLLVAHNIDLAPRIGGLRAGDTVDFYGEYEWNEKGGVIHWTHHDPGGRHVDGWLMHNGSTYQ
jgi:Protein of unknown function (DUF3465)